MAETANTPLVDAVQEAQPLSPGEQLVWAARFTAALKAGTSATVAARFAHGSVRVLRGIDTEKLETDEAAAVEQMRGGR